MTPTKSYPYTVVDVFTTEPLSGNSLAVFPDASEFDAAAMQKIARELNLTETAFVLPASIGFMSDAPPKDPKLELTTGNRP
jgi:trans-2,3-dihydro-3-hydroxyanthranilate isomerase